MKNTVLLVLLLVCLANCTISPSRRMKKRRTRRRHRHHQRKNSHQRQNPSIRNIDTRGAVTTHRAGDTHVNHYFPNGKQVIEGPMNSWQPIGQSAFSPTTITPSRQSNQFTYHSNVAPLVQKAQRERVVARAAPRVYTPQDKYDMMIDRIIRG